jgi:glucosamine 6-phosphate synthetase-like amidotransferase/phosphosugar isomerase protein
MRQHCLISQSGETADTLAALRVRGEAVLSFEF